MDIIIGKTAGFCYGVKRAVEGAKKDLKDNTDKTIYCLGELVHNKQVIDDLKCKGLIFINDIKDGNNNVIIRAHGIPKEIYNEAKLKQIQLKDYTCPNVLTIHNIVEEYSKKDYFVLLCGNINHPENIGTISYCYNNYRVIEDEKEVSETIKRLEDENINKILLISQTTYSLEKFEKVEEIIKNNIEKNIDLVVKNTICRATQIRQKETEEISKKVDIMIIIGGKNSSNTRKLYDISKTNCDNTFLIEDESELDINNIKKYNTIGIMAGTSTPKESIDNLIKKISCGIWDK